MDDENNALNAFFQLDSGEISVLLEEFKVTELYHMFAEDIEAYNAAVDAYTKNIEKLKEEIEKETEVRDALVHFKKNCDELERQGKQAESNPLKEEEKQQPNDAMLIDKKKEKSKEVTHTDKDAEKQGKAQGQKTDKENDIFYAQVGAEALGRLISLVLKMAIS